MARQTKTNRVNDFAIKFANVNGTGSASANGLIMKSFFRMGIPVSGKNYFPSNIQGLPTWYEIRVSRDGYVARPDQTDIVVAMNAETYPQDVKNVRPGGYLIYDSSWPQSELLARQDITILGIPLSRMCNETFDGARNRILMKNIAYAGALTALLQIDMNIIKTLLEETFGDKKHLIDANMNAIELGFNFARENFECPLDLHVEAMQGTEGRIILDGNTAAALGCLYAGAAIGAWYPITPSTSLMDAFKAFCERYRVDPDTGEKNFVIIQSEDELAAIGMVIGAGWNGVRAFTPTSGPGISLMSEMIGLAYYAEVPAVIFDVQRVGPSTGMPTRTQQGDLLQCAYASHGDTKHVLLFPADPEECFYLAVQAFDLTERLQTPVFVMSDLDIGMNDWMCPELEWDDSYVPDRGKVLTAEDLEKIDKFRRYVDIDGDHIAYRTLPGTGARGAYFTRGSGHNKDGQYTEDADEYQEVVDRLARKSETAAGLVPKPVIHITGKHNMGIVSIGSCDAALHEAIDVLAGKGIGFNYMRVRAFPFGQEVEDFLAAHDHIFVIEQNRDGQLRSLLILETRVEKAKLESILHYNGLPINAGFIVNALEERLARGKAA
ncbi:MAG: 2-oxoacid:acceptor oxidoreductase subunit alpha [Alphaproteobacteria bacterium]|nr:MAG: 2-oxoacid:acceptor oxidoreductase subunit alpha [Alphaproteobacteria bacterium]